MKSKTALVLSLLVVGVVLAAITTTAQVPPPPRESSTISIIPAYTATGKVLTQRGAPVYANVDLHKSTNGYSWVKVAGTTNTAAGYTVTSPPLAKGTYYFRTYCPGDVQTRESFSTVQRVVVT